MKLKNKYQKFSKITEPKFRQILRFFSLDLTASDTAKLTGISVRSINSLYLKLRRRLADECEWQTPFCGIVELDESYFGAKRIRGKRGRGAGGKTIVFGILKRGDKVYTEIVSDASKATLQKVIRDISLLRASSILMDSAVIRGWSIWALRSISECVMVIMNLPVVPSISTVSNPFGAALYNLTVCRSIRFTCI
ncbi:putative insertion element transposase [Neisseria canis]|uniref:Putative insertion element transposase n=1 Tax=Neisseria canis TaxID=493 RepID=A0A448D659_9NEIS|nr:putative insertion element transposase [Neisseria canis]